MTKNLLHRTTRSFLLLAVIILLISAPVFYFVSHGLYIYETDEVLEFHKEDFVRTANQKHFTDRDIAIWNQYNRSADILPDTGLTRDSIITREYLDQTSKELEPVRVMWAPIEIDGRKYTYTETNNLVVMEAMVVSIALLFLLVIALLMIGIIWLSKRSAQKLWAPFYDTLSQIEQFELDKKTPPQFVASDISEFLRLNKSLTRLIEKNIAIYQNQREFVENAAHELQTPLALFQTRIDALAQMNLNQQQAAVVAALDQDVSRLNRLNKNLLLLSKIENDTYFETEPIWLNEFLLRHLEFFTEQARARHIELKLYTESKVVVRSHAVLLDVLFNNLFLNAIRHNRENGEITVALHPKSVAFANTGSDTPLDPARLFNRFAKIDPSGKGNGLGLAIVHKAVTANGWTIDYQFKEGRHIFTVHF